MIYAVDFDGVLCEKRYPEIGNRIDKNVEYIKQLQTSGNTLILWTCRKDKELDDAVAWCADNELTFDAVNVNLPETIDKYGGDSRKVHADFYIDDKNILIDEVAKSINERKQTLIQKLQTK